MNKKSVIAAGVIAGMVVIAVPQNAEAASSLRMRAYYVAEKQIGDPYKYGAVGPNKFDCSGLMLYSYKAVGKTLPRTAQQQYNKSKKVAKANRTKGDLIFFGSSGNIYHVGIYAGYGKILHAPKPDKKVRIEKLWTSDVKYGRIN